MFEIQRRVLDEAHTLRGACEDNGTGLQCGALGEEGDSLANIEDLFAVDCRCKRREPVDAERDLRSGAILDEVSVQRQLELYVLRVRNQAVGHQTRTKRVSVICGVSSFLSFISPGLYTTHQSLWRIPIGKLPFGACEKKRRWHQCIRGRSPKRQLPRRP